VGTPKDVTEMVLDYHQKVGGFEIASLHVNPSVMPVAIAERSMRLFANRVMPALAKALRA
jgi:hypothetical protein